ncbi:ComF family protein [Ciceribacter sp. RN22]|uniref:ComF family protein n=1 Tax=Ciceribacter sp. RN22 TaxID=2954932 RepID=UPI002093F387|nr:ComF family protein [Ciceribacter sp. RN22]MCO6180196.1 ComF family protein [Ciceribacter sp. RN22]
MDGHIAQSTERLRASPLTTLGILVRDLVYPPSCVHCGIRVAEHGALCPQCWTSIRFIERPFCEVLGTPFPFDHGAGTLSPEAIADPPVFDRLRSVASHDGPVRDLVHSLKYRDRTDLAPVIARWMVRAGAEELATSDAVLAVPLHRTRLFARKFNQSAELARHIARSVGKPFLASAVLRVKRTARQVGLSANARADNVRGAFAVAPGCETEVFGRRLVLVDDVFTTGATVSAVARVLKRAGAADVTVLTFARALSDPI